MVTMARMYDMRTTIFSPEGRLYQASKTRFFRKIEIVFLSRLNMPWRLLATLVPVWASCPIMILSWLQREGRPTSCWTMPGLPLKGDLLAEWRNGVQRGRHHLRRQHVDQRDEADRAEVQVPLRVRGEHPLRAAGVLAVQHQACLHPVRGQEALQCLYLVHGVGQTLWLPALPVRPIRWCLQLRIMTPCA